MKTISFFSEKGGVGKSTFSIMYSSWLHGKMEVNVGLADFNHRIKQYREAEIRNRNRFLQNNPDSKLEPYDERKTWPIVECTLKEIKELEREGYRFPYAAWLEREINEGGRLHDCDIVVCDFPGSLTGGEFMQIINMGMLSLTVMPVEKDEMTLNSTMIMHNVLSQSKRNYCAFINKAQLTLRNFKNTYYRLGQVLTKRGLRLLPDMISYSDRITTIDKVEIIRSTFGFPDFESPDFGMSKDLGIINLFIDVSRELQKCPDLKGTLPSEMNFVNELVKKDDGRQLSGTIFPQYEISK